jgi:hypothetical protein
MTIAPKYCLFFDFHTHRACPDVGENFDVERLTDHFLECGVDYVTFPARCCMGLAYYDTKIGVKHPALKYDLFGKLAESCARKNIALSAYLNSGISNEETLLHRQWAVVHEDGALYKDVKSPFIKRTCYNTGYGDHLAAMVEEIASNYPVRGFFFDCVSVPPCIGVECVQEMKKLGMDCASPEDRLKFSIMSKLRMSKKLSDIVKKRVKDPYLFFNGLHHEEQTELSTYFELECLPMQNCWGYELLPVMSRYIRNFGKPALNMTGRFNKSWGDFGGIRTEPGLEYDALYGLANGLRPNIGDHMHPRGDIMSPVFSMAKNVYKKLQQFEPWLDEAKPKTEIALIMSDLYPGDNSLDKEHYEKTFGSLKSAARMLCEARAQFDVLSDKHDWTGYQVIVLPDFVRLDASRAEKLKKHLENGGKIISSYHSGLDKNNDAFSLAEWGIKYTGESEFDPAFIKAGAGLSDKIPEMALTLYERGIDVSPADSVLVLAEIISPYYNWGWDYENPLFYIPQDKATGLPAVTDSGRVIHFTHPIFTIYRNHSPVYLRDMFANALARVLPSPMVKTQNMPSFGRVTVTEQTGRKIIHVLSYLPETRGNNRSIIEEAVAILDFSVSLRLNGSAPKEVYLAPDRTPLEFAVKDGYAEVHVGKSIGYSMIVMEF